MLNVDLIPSSLSKACATFEMNCVPLSDMILSGSPYCLQVFSSRIWAVLSESIVFRHGMIIAVLVNLSITTWSESNPLDLGRSVMKSIVIVLNGLSGISIGWSGTIVGYVLFLVD